MISFLRFLTHIIFPVKRKQYQFIRRNAKDIKNKQILEIGAGEGYKVEKYFDISNDYIKTDLIDYENVVKLDVTKDKLETKYDVIICLNVLEHIYDYEAALANIYNGLKKGGSLFLSIPMFYPLHMLPDDYWRFTPSTLKKLLANYEDVTIKTNGLKRFPYNINVLAIK